ncbi:MAG TPA: glycosyltransferase family 2 protein [Flavobacteriales bacterium]|nr:glycosyltransferase family 2 protein [Flavobacteriales bacterium]HIN40585.1 glycosyltransferase family 2 protein [Flavobacteriales bacterium]
METDKINITPLVSIVIPSRNEEEFIGKCIDSILASDQNTDTIEILVCDGESDDQTIELVQGYTKTNSSVKLLVNKYKTTPHGLNLGIKNASGAVIMILGAHAEISPDYISKSISILNNSDDIGCVGGVLENIASGSANAISLAMSSPFGVGNAFFRTGNKNGYVDTVAFGAYKKEVFEKVGFFDEELIRNQDDELNYRLTKAGYKIFLSQEIRARYYVRTSYEKLFRQYFQYGYWKVYVNKKHKTLTTLRQLAPLFFVLFCFSGLIVPFLPGSFIEFYLLILGLYCSMSIIAAINKSMNLISILQIMYSFLILHISYGLGYLEGILHFYFLNRKPSSFKATSSRY